MTLSLAIASQIVDASLEEARRRRLLPLCATVVDAGGHIIAMKREDGANVLRTDISHAKAAGCAGTGLGGMELARRAHLAPGAFTGLIAASQGRLVGAQGGVLICDQAGSILGAIGVSGDASDADEACAIAGVTSAGLRAEPGVPATHAKG
jgi:uncharacterized protein GlcG (DUF336 family)